MTTILAVLAFIVACTSLTVAVQATLAARQIVAEESGPEPIELVAHPPACWCKGTGTTEAGRECPVLWVRPQQRVELVGRLPRGRHR